MGVKLSLIYLLSSHIYIYSWDKPSCQVRRERENLLCERRRVLHGERPFESLKILVQVSKDVLVWPLPLTASFRWLRVSWCTVAASSSFIASFEWCCFICRVLWEVHTIYLLCFIQNGFLLFSMWVFGWLCFFAFFFAFIFIKLLSLWFSSLLLKRDVQIS